MTIIKTGKKQPKDYAMFECAVCECEWAEEAKKVSWVEKNFDPMLMIDHTEYIMRCPCCSTQTATHKVDLIALEEGGAYLDGYDKGRKDGIEEGEKKASDIIIKNVIASLQEIKRGYRNLDEYIEQLRGCVR